MPDMCDWRSFSRAISHWPRQPRNATIPSPVSPRPSTAPPVSRRDTSPHGCTPRNAPRHRRHRVAPAFLGAGERLVRRLDAAQVCPPHRHRGPRNLSRRRGDDGPARRSSAPAGDRLQPCRLPRHRLRIALFHSAIGRPTASGTGRAGEGTAESRRPATRPRARHAPLPHHRPELVLLRLQPRVLTRLPTLGPAAPPATRRIPTRRRRHPHQSHHRLQQPPDRRPLWRHGIGHTARTRDEPEVSGAFRDPSRQRREAAGREAHVRFPRAAAGARAVTGWWYSPR